MRRSSERIITTHAGSLPRPTDLLDEVVDAQQGKSIDEKAHAARLRTAVKEIVTKQIELGIDVIDDGEFGKPDFAGYVNARLSGFSPGNFEVGGAPRRDIQHFPQYYEEINRVRRGG